MRKYAIALPIIGEALIVTVVQFTPMAILRGDDYAVYAAIYLFYAAALSVMFSSLSDVWGRGLRENNNFDGSDGTYMTILTLLALVASTATAAFLVVTKFTYSLSLFASLAVGLALFRAGSRYQLIALDRMLVAGYSDAIGAIIGGVYALVVAVRGAYSIEQALLVWFLVNLVGIILRPFSPRFRLRSARNWLRTHRRDIRSLLGDTALMNISSVVMPYVVGTVAGASTFALLRSASSSVYPVRLVLGALRAKLVSTRILTNRRSRLVLTIMSAIFGLGLWGVLLTIQVLGMFDSTVIGLLTSHAVEVGLLGCVTALSVHAQLSARGILSTRQILIRRVLHTIVTLVFTVGAVIVDPGYVIWGAAISTVVTWRIWDARTKPT